MIIQQAQTLRQHLTRWTNPTDRKIQVDLYTGTGEAKKDRRNNPSGYTRIIWEPGESIDLPAEYDEAIQKIDAQGKVIGGMAPQLLKNGSRHEVVPALDTVQTDATNAQEALLEAAKQ